MSFVVLPLLRENMHTVCDVPISFQDVLNEFDSKFPQGLDHSLIDTKLDNSWFLDDLNPEAQIMISKQNESTTQKACVSAIS